MDTSPPAAFALQRLEAGNQALTGQDIQTLETLLKEAALDVLPRCVAELVARRHKP